MVEDIALVLQIQVKRYFLSMINSNPFSPLTGSLPSVSNTPCNTAATNRPCVSPPVTGLGHCAAPEM